MNTVAKKVKALGYRVFIRKGGDSYAYFTDGKSIGYIQEERGGYCTSTVHIPNRTTGTGYKLDEINEPTKEALDLAFQFAPHWALNRDRESIKKYHTVETFLKGHNWGDGLTEYNPEATA